jgi:hypothetical protein
MNNAAAWAASNYFQSYLPKIRLRKIDRQHGRADRLRSDQANRRKLDYVMQRPTI